MAANNKQWVAKAISFIFHPIFIPLFFGLIYYPIGGFYGRHHLLVFIFLVAFPGLVTLLWLLFRGEQDMFVVSRTNRLVPLGAVAVGSVLLAFAADAWMPLEIFPGHLVLNVFIVTLLSFFVTLFWKISLHLIGFGAVFGAALVATFHGVKAAEMLGFHIPVYSPPILTFAQVLLLSVPIAVLVAWARGKLESHNKTQMFAGWLLGALTMSALTAFALLLN